MRTLHVAWCDTLFGTLPRKRRRPHAAAADDDQVGADGVGDLAQRVGRAPDLGVQLDLHAHTLGVTRGVNPGRVEPVAALPSSPARSG